MITLGSDPPSATMNTASLSPPSPEEQDTPRANFTMPPSKSVTSMGTDSVDSPLLGVLGVVELELAPDELPLDELEPQPEPEPEPEDDSSSPDPDPDPKGGQGGLATRARGALLVARPRTAT
jgi:hypothetical protein